ENIFETSVVPVLEFDIEYAASDGVGGRRQRRRVGCERAPVEIPMKLVRRRDHRIADVEAVILQPESNAMKIIGQCAIAAAEVIESIRGPAIDRRQQTL